LFLLYFVIICYKSPFIPAYINFNVSRPIRLKSSVSEIEAAAVVCRQWFLQAIAGFLGLNCARQYIADIITIVKTVILLIVLITLKFSFLIKSGIDIPDTIAHDENCILD
jgi:hypothetical protein